MSEDEIGVDVVIENEEGSIDIQSDVLKGDKGDKGDPTATIEINQVLTGEAGTEAKIDNIGTDVNMKLNITIPRGDTGEQGEPGYTPIKGTDYFTNEEIQQIKNKVLDEVNQFSVVVVSELPEENINDKTIYLVPKEAGEGDNIYSEYIYVSGKWELIGSTEIDASKLTVNLVENSYEVIITETVEANGIITIPAYYKVDTDRLDVYLNGDKLVKAEESDTEGHYYEVGTKGELSNTIQITSDWKPDISDVFEFVIRTNGQGVEVESDTMIVSSTEPSTKQKVWLQKGKNLFDAYTVAFTDIRCTHSIENSNKIILTATGIWARTVCTVSNLEPNKTYTINTKITNSNLNKVGVFENDDNSVIESTETFNSKIVMNSDSEGYLEFTIWVNWSNTSNTNSATFDEIQIEQGTEATEYEEYIEPKIYVKNNNGVYEEFISKESDLEKYSTDEMRIGTWIDGKPLYRKIITVEGLQTSGAKNVAHDIKNLDNVINISGSVILNYDTGTFKRKVPLSQLPGSWDTFINVGETAIIINRITSGSELDLTVQIILEYTKTTD